MRRAGFRVLAAAMVLALPFALAARADDAEDDEALLKKGNVLVHSGEYEKAIEVYKKALEINPKNLNVILSMGRCHSFLDREDEAKVWYEKVLDLDKDRDSTAADAYSDLGHVYIAKKNYEKAIEVLKKSLEISKDEWLTWRRLGDACAELDREEECLDAWERSIKLKPDQPQAEIVERDIAGLKEHLKGKGKPRKKADFEATFSLASFGGLVTTPDLKTLVAAVPSKSELAFFDTTTGDPPKRVALDFQPSRIVSQAKTIYAIAQGAAKLHVLELATGKSLRSFNLTGAPLVEIACHPTKGLLYGADAAGEVVSLDPSTGKVTATQATGTLIAVDPVKAFVYTAGPGARAGESSRTVLRKYSVQGADLKLLDTNPDVAVRGFSLHVTPDGKRIAVAGEGCRSGGKEVDRNAIALFETESIRSPAGVIDAGGRPCAFAFHPLLGVAVVATDRALAQLDAKSLVKSQTWPNDSSAPGTLAFAGRGTKLVYWQPGDAAKKQDGTLGFLSLKLSPDESAALEKALAKPR